MSVPEWKPAERELHELNGIRAEHALHTDSFLLCNGEIGTAKLPEGTLRITAGGKTMRIEIDGIDGYVDVSLNDIAVRAHEILVKPDAPFNSH